MRYWVWWNDLIQGPFEVEELTSLKAFTEELMVCMEDRQEWIPAGRVADLSGAIEQMRERRMAPKTPPPPPPRRPPSMTPLQGEFFSEAPGQTHLPDVEGDDAPKGPFAYLPVSVESSDPLAPYFVGIVTNPFHFTQQPRVGPQTSVIEMPRPQVRLATMEPPRVIKQSPIPKPEPEEIIRPKRSDPVPLEKPILLNLVESTAPDVLPEPEIREVYSPSLAPSMETQVASDTVPTTRWLPWIIGSLTVITALGAFAFWCADRANTRSAIQEARELKGQDPVVAPLAEVMPVRPVPFVRKFVPAVKTKAQASVASVMKRVKKVVPARKIVVKSVPAPIPAPSPTPAPVPVPPEPVENDLPGIAAPVPVEPEIPAEAPPAPVKKDLWSDKQNEAINLVMNKTIPGSKVSIKTQAKAMLDGMHEKELIHAAQTGERLFLPDKISWAALREEGARYRVYLNFLSWQASGERVQTRSYQFVVDMKEKSVKADDAMTQQDLFRPSADLSLKHNPMAVDIESILGGVDFYNKQMMRSMIVKKSRKNKEEQKNILSSQAAAREKLNRAVAFFRKTYTDQALQNIAKAYQFSELLKN